MNIRQIINLLENANGFYYHVTPVRNLKSIMEQGLVPKVGSRSKKIGEGSEGIYLFYTLAGVEDALNGWLGLEFSSNARLALLRVKEPPNAKISYGADYERIIASIIPPKNIEVLSRDLFGEPDIRSLGN